MHDRIRPFRAEDAEYIIDHIRNDDRLELEALGLDAQAGVTTSVENSTYLFTAEDKDGNPAFIVGVHVNPNSSSGIIWLLGTDAIEREPKTFLLASRPTLEALFNLCGVSAFYNFVWKGNTVHINWLKWLGFHFMPETGGPNKDFIFFYKHRE
jgi:hypothetical protein